MVFELSGGRRVRGKLLDELENELGQMVDETAALLRR
jgi:hypothetical protein